MTIVEPRVASEPTAAPSSAVRPAPIAQLPSPHSAYGQAYLRCDQQRDLVVLRAPCEPERLRRRAASTALGRRPYSGLRSVR